MIGIFIMNSSTTPRLIEIQWLRALAAILVAVGHTLHEAKKFSTPDGLVHTLHAAIPYQVGVDIFFVISGFIMAYVTWGKLDIPGFHWTFLRARLVRIVPIYWFYTFLLTGVAFLVPSVLDTVKFSIENLLSSLLFLPGLLGAEARPLLKLGWTLNFEMFFYVVFFFSIFIAGRRALFVVLLCFLCLIALKYFGFLNSLPWHFWSRSIILEFCYGMAISVLFHRGFRLNNFFATCLVIGAVVMLLVFVPQLTWSTRFWVLGIPSALLVFAFACCEMPTRLHTGVVGRFVTTLGDASYNLYLMHPFVISVMAIIFGRLGMDVWSFFIATLAAIIVGAVIGYRLIELPLTHATRRFVSPQKAKNLRT